MRKSLIGLLIAILVALIFLPQLLSSTYGKPLFEKVLGKKLGGKVAMGSAHLSWFGPQSFENIEFANPEITGSIEKLESNVTLWTFSDFGNSFLLKKGYFFFPQYGNLSIGPVDALITGHDVQATGNASQGGTFTVNGKIYSKSDFDLNVKFSKMPSAPLDQLLQANGILAASLGPSFDLSTTAVYNQGIGHIDADLSSTNGAASLRGQIAQDTLSLKEPFAATLKYFTPELSDAMNGRILEAKNPITLRIETAGASFPLTSFSLDRLEIGQATLDLGQLVCTGLHPLISLFALLNQAPIASSTAVIWFTPVDLSAKRGTFHVDRIDGLISNSVHLCAWGDVLFPKGKLNMVLGIPVDTLEQTLGITGLSRNYILQIPVRGSVQNPKLDTSLAAAKIAAMAAGQQFSKISKKTGPLGVLFNQIPMAQEDKDVPPAKRPFPWER